MLAEECALSWRLSSLRPKLLSGFIGLALSEIIIAKFSGHSSKRSTSSDDSRRSVDQVLKFLENSRLHSPGCTARLL